MRKITTKSSLAAAMVLVALTSCDHQDYQNDLKDALRIDVQQLPEQMQKVRDYVPLYAVIAHRGTTYWAPEETESAWRWAREMGADYLESDLQATKDCIVLANHDENLARTTNVENVFSEYVPASRKDFYRGFRKDGSWIDVTTQANNESEQAFTNADIDEQYAQDVATFRPFYTMSYYYHELLMLDAGAWFNQSSLEQARPGFEEQKQYVSAIQDQIAYAEGKRLKREGDGQRIPLTFRMKSEFVGKSLADIRGMVNQAKYMAFVEYDFNAAYEADPEDTGNRPGIYPEFKESWLNPSNMEQLVYDALDECGWNIMTKPAPAGEPFYKDGKVNVGNTNGKVILQTFSFDALRRAHGIFKGEVPMCYLLYNTPGSPWATDIAVTDPTGYADFINYAMNNGAHIIGPSIAGAPNNYEELNAPWQAYLIRKALMLNHPYSFDSYAQMGKYLGLYNKSNPTDYDDLMLVPVDPTSHTVFTSPQEFRVYLDGLFTNRTEMTLRYMIDEGFRCNPRVGNPFGGWYDNSGAPAEVPDAEAVLARLGY